MKIDHEECKNCESTFGDFHARVAHLCKPYRCSHCSERFLYDYQLKMHEIECSGEKQTGDKINSFLCNCCDSTFKTSKLLSQHKSLCFEKHNIKQCDVCKKEFSFPEFRGRTCKICKQTATVKNGQKSKGIEYNISKDHEFHNLFLNQLKNIYNISSLHNEHAAEEKETSEHNSMKYSHISTSHVPIASTSDDDKTNSDRNNNVVSISTISNPVKKHECEFPSLDSKNAAEPCRQNSSEPSQSLDSSNVPNSFERLPESSESLNTGHKFKHDRSSKCKQIKENFPDNMVRETRKRHARPLRTCEVSKVKIAKRAVSERKAKKLKTELCSDEFSNMNVTDIPDSKPQLCEKIENVSENLKTHLPKKKNIGTSIKGCDVKTFLNDVLEQQPNLSLKSDEECGLEKSFAIDVKNIKQENYKRVLSDDSGSSTKKLKISNVISHAEPLSENSNNNKAIETSVRLKKRNNKSKKISKSQTAENLILNSEVVLPCTSSSASKKNNRDSSKLKNFERELEVSNCTLNSFPEDLSFSNVSKINKKAINLKSVLKLLPDENWGFLLRVAANTSDSYKCPKCNKLFKQIKTGSIHFHSCKRVRFRRNLQFFCDDIEFICTNCHFSCIELQDLLFHRKSCIRQYQNTRKNYICKKCCYSCLSLHAYNQHLCNKRLEEFKTCVVDVKKLTVDDLSKFVNLAKLQCSTCNAIFFDDSNFEKHKETHLTTSIQSAKTYIAKVKQCIRKEVEKIVKRSNKTNNSTNDSFDSFVENVVESVAKMNSTVDPGNNLPDVNPNFSIPYETRKLIQRAAEKYFTTGIFDKNAENERSDKVDDGVQESVQEPDYVASQMQNSRCRDCKTVNKADIKPCCKCLHNFLSWYKDRIEDSELDQLDDEQEQDELKTPTPNDASIILINNVVSGTPSSDCEGIDNSASTSAVHSSLPENQDSENKDTSTSSTLEIAVTSNQDSLAPEIASKISDDEEDKIQYMRAIDSIFKKESCSICFSVRDLKMTVDYQTEFDKDASYSVYIQRDSRKFICSTCMLCFSPYDLVKHLLDEHKLSDIKMLVL